MTIIFRQLPDIHSYRNLECQGLRSFGRFGLMPDGCLWIGYLYSSHPRELLVGWYFAIDEKENLILSSRNIATDIDLLQGEGITIIKHLLHNLAKQGIVTRKHVKEVVNED